jgi:hypothetical protein
MWWKASSSSSWSNSKNAEEDEVENADGAAVEELGQLGRDLPVELVPWEADDDVLHRTHAHALSSESLVFDSS